MKISHLFTTRRFLGLAVCALALVSFGVQAAGFDVSGFVAAHAEVLAGLGMLGMAGEIKTLEDLKEPLRAFTEAATKKIDDATARVKQLEEDREKQTKKIAELQAITLDAAQHAVGGAIGGYSSSESPDIGASLVEELDLDGLRTNRAKASRTGFKSFFSKANIVSGSVPMQGERDTEIYGPLRRPSSVRDLLQVRPTSAGSIEYLRGTRTGAAGIQANEGDAKAELALAFSLQTSHVRTIACWVPAARQVLDDASELSSYIDLELRDALRLTEDAQLLNGSGTGSNILGLMTAATAYDRAVAGDGVNDTMRRAITQVQLARGVASGIVVNPEALERLELEKDAEGRYLMAFNVTDSNGRTVTWRVPVVVTDGMAAEEFLVGDFTRAARLYDRQEAIVEVATQHADFFTRNLVAILAEERVALTINRPDLLVHGTFPSAGA